MTKRRVSVKGKGADIFFGDVGGAQAPAVDAPALPAEPSVAPRAAGDELPEPAVLASKKARKQEDTRASKKAAAPDTEPPGLVALLDALGPPLRERATITNAFRYTEQDLLQLEDAIYELHKKYRVKLTKQDVARLGLNAVLLDYWQHGEGSLLGEFARRRKQNPDGAS